MTHARCVLVLGGGIYQVPLIRTARRRGLRCAVASVPGNYPGIDLADVFLPIDTTDERGVVSAARELDACAVVTTGTDVAMRSLGAACDALCLPGPSLEMASRATNKLDMKRALVAGEVRTARFAEARDETSALAAWDELGSGGPVMVKCPDRSGSRGITLVRSRDEVPSAFRAAVEASLCGYAVVERFVEGHEVGVDGFVDPNGGLALLAPHDKLVRSNGHTNVPVGHFMNDAMLGRLLETTDLRDQVLRCVRAVGMRDCFFNMDVLVDERGRAWVIEVGVRAGATCIPEVVGSYYGFDYYEAILDAALGIAPRFPDAPAHGAAEGRLLVRAHGGTASGADAHAVASDVGRRWGLVIEASFDYAPGEQLPPFTDGTSRVGQLVCAGDDADRVSRALDEAQERLLEAYLA